MLLGRHLLMPGVLEDTQSTWVAPFLPHSPKECLKCRQKCGDALAYPVGAQAVILLACRKEERFTIQNHGLRKQHQNCWERAPTLLSLPLQKSWNKKLPVKPRDSSVFRHRWPFLVPFSVHLMHISPGSGAGAPPSETDWEDSGEAF